MLRIFHIPLLVLFFVPSVCAAQSFSDVPKDHFAFEAIEYLKEQGVLSGYDDGTFKPGKTVNRAESIKILIAPLINKEELATATSAKTVYKDVPNNSWYKPYVELARTAGVIDGPPAKKKFNGENTVIKAEFLKMVQEAYNASPKTAFAEIKLPLSQDVTNVDEWYYPYMRYAITSSMTMISSEGTLSPGKKLTRAETALLLYRYMMYKKQRRTQALLSETESEILITLAFLEQKNIEEAEYASARALLAARGAHMSRPNEPVVQGAVKTSEAFRALVRAYRAGSTKDFEETIRLSGEAWNLASRGRELAPELQSLSEQVQTIAKTMADSARAEKAALEEGGNEEASE